MTVRERIAAQLQIDETRVGLGVGLGDPTDRRDALMIDGRSVWAADAPIDIAVAESPNWFGVLDGEGSAVAAVDIVRCDRQGSIRAVRAEVFELRGSQGDHGRAVQRLGGALSAYKGISLPWGRPVCPWFSIRTAIPASAWARIRGDFVVEPPAARLGNFLPGVVRVVPEPGFEVSEYAAALTGFVEDWVRQCRQHEDQHMKGTE